MPKPIDPLRLIAGFLIGLVWTVFFGPTTRAEVRKYADDFMGVT